MDVEQNYCAALRRWINEERIEMSKQFVSNQCILIDPDDGGAAGQQGRRGGDDSDSDEDDDSDDDDDDDSDDDEDDEDGDGDDDGEGEDDGDGEEEEDEDDEEEDENEGDREDDVNTLSKGASHSVGDTRQQRSKLHIQLSSLPMPVRVFCALLHKGNGANEDYRLRSYAGGENKGIPIIKPSMTAAEIGDAVFEQESGKGKGRGKGKEKGRGNRKSGVESRQSIRTEVRNLLRDAVGRKSGVSYITEVRDSGGGAVQRYRANLDDSSSGVIAGIKIQTLFQIVRSKYGMVARRVFSMLLEKESLESKTLGERAMRKDKDVRHVLYAMHADGFVNLQDVPRRPDRNPQSTYYLWTVDRKSCYDVLLQMSCKVCSHTWEADRQTDRKKLINVRHRPRLTCASTA